MSSRGGPRAEGTDGTDHRFRQVVDPRYARIAATKEKLYQVIYAAIAYHVVALIFALLAVWKGGLKEWPYGTFALSVVGIPLLILGLQGPKGKRAEERLLAFFWLMLTYSCSCAVTFFEQTRASMVFGELLEDWANMSATTAATISDEVKILIMACGALFQLAAGFTSLYLWFLMRPRKSSSASTEDDKDD